MSYPQEVTTSFELELDSMIEISIMGSDSSVNHPSRSKSKIGEDIGLNA